MTFKEFIASHTGRHFFDSFREFVASFKTYVEHLSAHNAQLAERKKAYEEAVEKAKQQQQQATIDTTQLEGECVGCGKVCQAMNSVVLGYKGTVRLMCDPCATEKGILKDDVTRRGN